MTLRRGFQIAPASGFSNRGCGYDRWFCKEVIDLVQEVGGEVVGVGIIGRPQRRNC